MKDWHPAGVNRWRSYGRPEVGEVVAFEMRAWVVTHAADAELEEEELARFAMERWEGDAYQKRLPYMLTLRRLHGPKYEGENNVQEVGFRVPAFNRHAWEKYDESRVPLCSCCGHPWPCLNLDATVEAQKTAEVMDQKLAKAGVPGTCYACGEPITTRQGSVTYPEDNIELIGYPGPRFHTRQACAGGWYEYERKRQQVMPDAEPVYAPAQSTALWGD